MMHHEGLYSPTEVASTLESVIRSRGKAFGFFELTLRHVSLSNGAALVYPDNILVWLPDLVRAYPQLVYIYDKYASAALEEFSLATRLKMIPDLTGG